MYTTEQKIGQWLILGIGTILAIFMTCIDPNPWWGLGLFCVIVVAPILWSKILRN